MKDVAISDDSDPLISLSSAKKEVRKNLDFHMLKHHGVK